MPRTKGKPARVSPRVTSTNGRTEEVLTLPEAAAYLRLTESAVVDLAHSSDRLHCPRQPGHTGDAQPEGIPTGAGVTGRELS
jgi:hypothetical protein